MYNNNTKKPKQTKIPTPQTPKIPQTSLVWWTTASREIRNKATWGLVGFSKWSGLFKTTENVSVVCKSTNTRLPHQSRQKCASTPTMLFQGKANTKTNNTKQIPKGTHPYDTTHLSTGEQYYLSINTQKVNTTFIPAPQLRSWCSGHREPDPRQHLWLLAQQSCTASRSDLSHLPVLNHTEMSSCACQCHRNSLRNAENGHQWKA